MLGDIGGVGYSQDKCKKKQERSLEERRELEVHKRGQNTRARAAVKVSDPGGGTDKDESWTHEGSCRARTKIQSVRDMGEGRT